MNPRPLVYTHSVAKDLGPEDKLRYPLLQHATVLEAPAHRLQGPSGTVWKLADVRVFGEGFCSILYLSNFG